MIRWCRLMALVALSASPVAAKAAMPWPDGLYSDVHSIEETGDILGMEARFYREGARHMVEFALCEGWCTDVHVAEVRRGDNGFTFGFAHTIDMHIVVWPAGSGLRYSIYQGRENIDPDGKPQRMRRASKLFGIAVAKSGKE